MVPCDMRCFVLKIPWLLLQRERSSLPTDLGERPSKHVHVTNAVLSQTRGGVAVVSSLIPVSTSTSYFRCFNTGGGGYSNLFNLANLVLASLCTETNTFLH